MKLAILFAFAAAALLASPSSAVEVDESLLVSVKYSISYVQFFNRLHIEHNVLCRYEVFCNGVKNIDDFFS